VTADAPAAPAATLVTRLLDDELATLRLQVAAGHRDQALKALDERGNAQELVRQQYSGRYAFELLQNANDAAIGSSGQAAVRFQVTDTSLVVANMGTGFGEDEVRAICSLGRSSKNPRKTLGYKGLGFKSVGEITSSPQVFSPPHCFGFDALRARRIVEADAGPLVWNQRLPVYALPLPLQLTDAGDDSALVHELLESGFVTALRLPYRTGVTRASVAEAVTAMLTPELLLLLDATDRLELAGTDADFEAERLVETGDPFDEVLLSVDGDLQQWRVRRQRHDVPDPQLVAAIDGWAHVTAVSTTVAARHDGSGRVDAEPVRPLHVYFPLSGAARYYEGGTIPWVVSGELKDAPLSGAAVHITDAALKESSAKWVPVGSVLVAMYGATIGKLSVTLVPVATNQAVAHAFPMEGQVGAEYLFWYLRSQRRQLVAAGQGGAQPNISQTVLKTWRLNLPDLDAQQEAVVKAQDLQDRVARLESEIYLAAGRRVALSRALLAAAFSGRLSSDDSLQEGAHV